MSNTTTSFREGLVLVLQELRACGLLSARTFGDWVRVALTGIRRSCEFILDKGDFLINLQPFSGRTFLLGYAFTRQRLTYLDSGIQTRTFGAEDESADH